MQFSFLTVGRSIARFIPAVAVALAAGWQAHAAGYPERPVRVVVPYPPGGNVDITTRTVVAAMSKVMGDHPLVVENIGGAAGSIGSANVARAQPDGYTVLASTIIPLVVNPVLMPGTPVKLEDFSPIGMMAVVPSVLEANASDERYRDFRGFVQYAKAHAGRVSIGHSGNGTTNHLAILQLMRELDIQLTPVPYKGSAPALTNLLGGELDAMVDQLTSSQPHIDSGKFKPLAVTAAERVPGLPDVPTVAELIGKDFQVVTYTGLLGPRDMPIELRRTLNDALRKALADPAVKEQLGRLGAQPVVTDIDQTSALLERERRNLQAVIDSGMLKPE